AGPASPPAGFAKRRPTCRTNGPDGADFRPRSIFYRGWGPGTPRRSARAPRPFAGRHRSRAREFRLVAAESASRAGETAWSCRRRWDRAGRKLRRDRLADRARRAPFARHSDGPAAKRKWRPTRSWEYSSSLSLRERAGVRRTAAIATLFRPRVLEAEIWNLKSATRPASPHLDPFPEEEGIFLT